MSEYDSYSGGYSTSNVFERLAVSETHSSARKRNTGRKPGHGYGGGASSVSSRSFSVSRSRPSTPASLYETPSFNSSSSSRKVNPAIFDRLATTETYATATMKGKVPERGRSKSTSKRTSNAFFERMAYTETFASAQMKGLIDTDDGASKASNGNAGRPVSRGRSVKSTRSAKSTRSTNSTSKSRGGESFFDRMANTDTYASAQLKGKYNFEKTASPRHTPARYKPSPRSTPKNRISIFDRLSTTQTLSSAGKNRKTPDPARSYRSMHSQNYPQSGSSLRKPSTRSYGSSYSPHHKYSSTASVGSTRSNFTARSQRSATSVRSAYTAPSTRTARTAASTARSSSSSRGMSSSFSSSYHSHSNDYVKPVARYAKPAPVAQVPIHSRSIPVLATSPTPEKLYGKTARRPPTPESSFGKRTSSNGSSRRSLREPAVNPPSPMSASMSKAFTSTRKTESKPVIRGLSSVSQPITTTIPKKAPEIEPKPPSPPPRPVLQFESDDELSFGDDSEEDDDFLAAPSSVSSVKAAPQDAGSTVISETKEGNNIKTVVSEDSIPENSLNDLALKTEEEPITITKDRGFDSREEFVLDPESEEEGVVEPITSDVLDESDEDGSYHMDNEEPESENEKSEKSEEKMQQDDEPIVAATSTQEAAEESDDGLSIGSGESEDDDWLTGTGTKSEDNSEPVENSQSALEEEDELGDLLDSEAESAELSVEEAPSRADSVESVDSIEISEQVTDDAQDVDTFDDVEEDEEVDADPDDFPDDLDEEEAEDQDYYNEEIDQLDSLDLVLDATGDEYDVSVNGDEDEILEEIGEKSEENDDEEEYVAESMEDEDYLSEDGVSVGDDDELDDVLEEAPIKPEESTEEEDYVAESMDDEEYMSEGEDDDINVDPAEEVRDMVEEEPAEEVLDAPTYTIVKSEKYHPQFGFEPVNPDEIFLTETLLAFESGEISNQEIAVLLIEALFEKDFENGDHWEIDAGTARELEDDEGGGGDMEGRAFVVKRQARLDWNDLYSVAAAKGNIIISPEKKEIRVENYSYFVAG